MAACLVAREGRAQTCTSTGIEVCESGGAFAQVDNDCDGNVNTTAGVYSVAAMVGAQQFFRDDDRDGYGDPTDFAWLCSREREPDPLGWTFDRSDCNDADPAVRPGAVESCNGVDDDCDLAVDDPDPFADPGPGCVTHWADADADGFGTDDPDGTSACICPLYAALTPGWPCTASVSGPFASTTCWSPEATDCADDSASIHPGALDRINGADDDCDGLLAAVELDCDNDGAHALVPHPAPSVFDEPDAEGLDLTPCTEVSVPPTLECFGADLPLICDTDRGLWVVRSTLLTDLEVFSNGRRVGQTGPCTAMAPDCDDTCPARCLGQPEACDGVDNDCAGAWGADADSNGLPDAMTPSLAPLGWVSSVEVGLTPDGEALYECGSLPYVQDAQALSTCAPVPVVAAPEDTDPDVEDDPFGDEAIAGCGCDGTGGVPVGALVALLAILPRRRR